MLSYDHNHPLSLSHKMIKIVVCLLLVLQSLTLTENADCGDGRPCVVSHGRSGWLCTEGYDAYPFIHPVSYTAACTGYPMLYLSPSEPVRTDPHLRASLAISEGDRLDLFPQIVLFGKLRKLPEHSEECSRAERALFEAHPSLRGFPKLTNTTYSIYMLVVDQVYLTNKGGMPTLLSLDDYLYVNYE
ncbi:uncharacterized protein LOC125192210 [Salvia hispanica]|uniref:uncharacterized protein LOC125192210 n=1 Tax=Salvia hispanica TaxID=49212 RepID=UPI0020099190|nr:uncharacterized protein LOC125192210 [Salvia hispanica]